MIRIRSKVDGFRRCGVPHPSEWKEHKDDRFTPEQLKILEAEPMLQVERALPELKLDGNPGGDMTKAQITAKLTELGIEIPKAANKPELQALLDDAQDKKPDGEGQAQDGQTQGSEG